MGVLYRKDRKRWGFKKYHQRKPYVEFRWKTKAEAEDAFSKYLQDLKKNPPLKPTAFQSVVSQYLTDSATRGRSAHRLSSMRSGFASAMVPFFGSTRDVTTITGRDVEAFVIAQKKRGLMHSTIWGRLTDLTALFNWAQGMRLVYENPVKQARLKDLLGAKRTPKKIIDIQEDVERAASVLTGEARGYFDCLRFTGLRPGELNRVCREHFTRDFIWLNVPGTKTEKSQAPLPIAPYLRPIIKEQFARHKSEYLFPGRKGKPLRRSKARLFERIERLTGVKLRAKDLRDYFVTVVPTDDPRVLMWLMRHTSMEMMSKYLRLRQQAMAKAVKNLGTSQDRHS